MFGDVLLLRVDFDWGDLSTYSDRGRKGASRSVKNCRSMGTTWETCEGLSLLIPCP